MRRRFKNSLERIIPGDTLQDYWPSDLMVRCVLSTNNRSDETFEDHQTQLFISAHSPLCSVWLCPFLQHLDSISNRDVLRYLFEISARVPLLYRDSSLYLAKDQPRRATQNCSARHRCGSEQKAEIVPLAAPFSCQ